LIERFGRCLLLSLCVTTSLSSAEIEKLAVYGDRLLVGGQLDHAAVAAWDGSDWFRLDSPFDEDIQQHDIILLGKGGLDNVNWNNVFCVPVSSDSVLSSWRFMANGVIMTLAPFDCCLIAGGTFSYVDGYGPPTPGRYFHQGVPDELRVGRPANHVATWDGTSWTPLGAGVNDQVMALVEYDRRLIVAGNYSAAGDSNINCIAAWDGHIWSPLGDGVGGVKYPYVHAVKVFKSVLIAAGWFREAGRKSANHIASWNGSSWSSLGTGLDSYVGAVITFGEKLIAGGRFVTAGGDTCKYVAQWDGVEWTSLGSGVWGGESPRVAALSVFKDKLIVGGKFDTAGGYPANGLALWDGASWLPLGIEMALNLDSINRSIPYNE
jgi:hypothetical protein